MFYILLGIAVALLGLAAYKYMKRTDQLPEGVETKVDAANAAVKAAEDKYIPKKK